MADLFCQLLKPEVDLSMFSAKIRKFYHNFSNEIFHFYSLKFIVSLFMTIQRWTDTD